MNIKEAHIVVFGLIMVFRLPKIRTLMPLIRYPLRLDFEFVD